MFSNVTFSRIRYRLVHILDSTIALTILLSIGANSNRAMAISLRSPSWQPRSIADLYRERDLEGWYWRWLAAMASSLILLG